MQPDKSGFATCWELYCLQQFVSASVHERAVRHTALVQIFPACLFPFLVRWCSFILRIQLSHSKRIHFLFKSFLYPKRDLDFLDLFFIQIPLLKFCIILDFPAQCRYYHLSCKTDRKNHLCLYLLHLVKIQFLQL